MSLLQQPFCCMKFCVNDLEILYLDNHLLAVNKPSGLLTQPSDAHITDLETQAKLWIKNKFDKPGNVFLHPIHRLDKQVSGIVLFARTSKALSRLNTQMRERKIRKIYIAQIEGSLPSNHGELVHMLCHGEHRAYVSQSGKEARLTFTVIDTTQYGAVVEIVLHTGRYHQIRVQFAQIGHPLIGDTKYGSQYPATSIALHHTKMTFHHPVSGAEIVVESALDGWPIHHTKKSG